jgi:hypothetical protein
VPVVSKTEKQNDIVEIKPEFFGISLNVNEIVRRFRLWLKSRVSLKNR